MPKTKNRKFVAKEEQKVGSELKNRSDEKSTSKKGSNSALDGKVSKFKLTEKIDISKNEQHSMKKKKHKKKTKKKRKKKK